MSTRNEIAADALQAWAAALRGDWGDIDGRSCRAQLAEIQSYLRGNRDTLTLRDIGVCDLGGSPHWDEGEWNLYMHNGTPCLSAVSSGGEIV